MPLSTIVAVSFIYIEQLYLLREAEKTIYLSQATNISENLHLSFGGIKYSTFVTTGSDRQLSYAHGHDTWWLIA